MSFSDGSLLHHLEEQIHWRGPECRPVSDGLSLSLSLSHTHPTPSSLYPPSSSSPQLSCSTMAWASFVELTVCRSRGTMYEKRGAQGSHTQPPHAHTHTHTQHHTADPTPLTLPTQTHTHTNTYMCTLSQFTQPTHTHTHNYLANYSYRWKKMH